VENSVDRCPNSSIVDIVDQNGCPIERVSLKDISTYDISIGIFKSKSDNGYTKSLSIGYIKGDFSVYLYTSKYEEDYSLKSNSISFTYKFLPKQWIGVGIYNSDDTDDKDDYYLSYKRRFYFDGIEVDITAKHIFIMDKAEDDINSLSLALGYEFNDKFYANVSYKKTDYTYNKNTLTLYTNYYITDRVYILTDYTFAFGTSSLEDSFGLNIGYTF
jgi:hypothetical protein